ncbi:MAG TPA: FAD-dependent oxidoreductase [Actinomycetota bacterium]|nr:FAD-dependent oxidoreductase [Actinomycetota bacterium]
MTERLVVIGGDAGGMTAASQARRLRGPDDLSIVAFERGHFTSYSSCGIPYFVGDVVDDLDTLIVRTPEEFARSAIEARVRHEVVEIDLEAGKVRVRGLDSGTESWEGYDELLVATGAVPARPPLPGIDARNVFGVQTLDDGVAIKEALETVRPRHAVVVGGGYIGLEMAEALVVNGVDVSVVEAAPQPMTTLDPEMGALVADAMRGMGMHVYVEEPVEAFESKEGAVSAVVTEGQTLPADVVVLGLGARPNSKLAQEAGLPVGERTRGVVVDQRMHTPVENVWAAGDVTEKFHRVSREKVAIALGTHANKEGRAAGINIGGGYETFPGVVGTAVSKVCDLEVARTGLTEAEAKRAGFDFVTATIDSTTRAGYFPGSAEIKTKFVAERASGRLLGAQIIGREGAAKRIDVCATALWCEMTVDEMLNVDLSYAPPFSPLWDPVLVAARKAWQAVQG